MLRNVYVIYDKTAGEVFGPVMLSSNDAVAVRTFRDALFHDQASHREDYDLYCLGTLDTETGAINAVAEAGSVFGVVSPVVTGAALVAASSSSSGGDNGAS